MLAYQTLEVKGVGAFQGFTETFTQSFIASQGRGAVSPSNLSDNGKSSSYGWGVQIGAIWDINPMFSLGASIRTKMYMSDFDDYSDLLAESGGFDMPAVGTIGLAVRPNKQLTFALDVQQIWYGDVDSIANDNTSPSSATSPPPSARPATAAPISQAPASAAPMVPASAGTT